MKPTSKIWTFYSYKGGVGRTFILADVAVRLATWGHRVLMVDWDLEAPGLVTYFRSQLSSDAEGLLDYLTSKRSRDLSGFVEPLQIDMRGELSILRAGQRVGYSDRLHSIDWTREFETGNLADRLEQFRSWGLDTFDFVLLDSRTGNADTAGICTVFLPDHICGVVGPNHQNIEGLSETYRKTLVLRSRLVYERAAPHLVPLLSRFDSREEHELSIHWKDTAAERLGPFTDSWVPKGLSPLELFSHLSIPNVPYWTYGELVPALHESRSVSSPSGVSFALEGIAALIAHELESPDELISERERYISSARQPSRVERSTSDAVARTDRLVRAALTSTAESFRASAGDLFLGLDPVDAMVSRRIDGVLEKAVQSGGIVILEGPSGSGKTTLLRSLGVRTDARQGPVVFIDLDYVRLERDLVRGIASTIEASSLEWIDSSPDCSLDDWESWKVSHLKQFAAAKGILRASKAGDGPAPGGAQGLPNELLTLLAEAEYKYQSTTTAESRAIDILQFISEALRRSPHGGPIVLLVDNLDVLSLSQILRALEWLSRVLSSSLWQASAVIATRDSTRWRALEGYFKALVVRSDVDRDLVEATLQHRRSSLASARRWDRDQEQAFDDISQVVAQFRLGTFLASLELASWLFGSLASNPSGPTGSTAANVRALRTRALQGMVLGPGAAVRHRPQLPNLIADLVHGRFDVLVALYAVDRRVHESEFAESRPHWRGTLELHTGPCWPYHEPMLDLHSPGDGINGTFAGRFFAENVLMSCEYVAIMALFAGYGPEDAVLQWESVDDRSKLDMAVRYVSDSAAGLKARAEWPSQGVDPARALATETYLTGLSASLVAFASSMESDSRPNESREAVFRELRSLRRAVNMRLSSGTGSTM